MYFMLLCTLVIALSEAKQIEYADVPPRFTSLMYEKAPGCIAESGAEPEILQRLTVWNLEDNETSRIFSFCLFRSMGLSDENGHFYVDKVLALFENSDKKVEIARASVECNKTVGENPASTMYNTVQCFYNKSPVYLRVKSD